MRISLIAVAAATAISLAACGPSSNLEAETTPVADTETDTTETAADPYLWMEEVEGEEALAWVTSQNDRSLASIQAHPLYESNLDKAMELATDEDRIPYASIRDGLVYNFWQDETNTRGLWRRTTLDSYKTDNPDWETIVDFDKLAEAEDKNWVYKGANCFKPADATKYLCMVSLSDGGKDAVINREFDLETKTWVDGGLVTPEAKQGLAWVDHDTILIGTDWGGDGSTLTESGYPSVVKEWKRGTPLESAKELYRGDKTDVGVWPFTLEKDDGSLITGAVEANTFFTSQYWQFTGEEGENAVRAMPLPEKATPNGIYQGWLVISLEQDWAPNGEGTSPAYSSGDLIALDIEDFLVNGGMPETQLVFRPNDKQAVNGVAIAKDTALLSINDNVVGQALKLNYLGDGGWTTEPLELPGKGQAGIAFADREEETVFLNYEGFLTPDSLLMYDAESGEVSSLKSLPPKFDTAGLVVHQKEATSKDGTKIPYFAVHREGIELDGTNPTLLYGYGGFQVSMNPGYSANVGRLWLEKGGIYVLANIRGGGEFGPEWHQAGLKGNRQRIYDDFIAVGEDLIAKKITTPEHLGIMGGSNGGLLMGVMMTQRPDLWNAVVVQVPLLDMLRYHKLLAGASWVDEYGDPDNPEERPFLEQISPYQNFDASADYPTPFFVTSTKDDRVHPGHARKMAKLFEDADKPFLYYENIDGGHSAAANQKERAKRTALEFTYLYERLFPASE